MAEIKLFNEWLETNEVSSAAITLWYALMYVANRSGWKPELSIPVSTLSMRTKLSRSSIYREREALREKELVDFDQSGGRQSSTYRIISFESRLVSRTDTQHGTQTPEASRIASHPETQTGTQPEDASHVVSSTETQDGTQTAPAFHSGTQSGIIYKPKQDISSKKRDKSSSSKKDSWDLSFAGDQVWEELLRIWLEYKHSRNQSYKSELSVKKFFSMLRNLSRGNPETARQIVDKSIANNWAGIFELQNTCSQPRGQPATGQRIGQIKQPEDESRRQKLLEKFDKRK